MIFCQFSQLLRPSFFLLADDSLASLGEKDDDEEEAPEMRMTTPPRINIELVENDGLEDVFPFSRGVFSGSMLIFQGVASTGELRGLHYRGSLSFLPPRNMNVVFLVS